MLTIPWLWKQPASARCAWLCFPMRFPLENMMSSCTRERLPVRRMRIISRTPGVFTSKWSPLILRSPTCSPPSAFFWFNWIRKREKRRWPRRSSPPFVTCRRKNHEVSRVARRLSSPSVFPRCSGRVRLFHGNYAVTRDVVQNLPHPAGPENFDFSRNLRHAQAEMHAAVARRRIPHTRRNVIVLLHSIFADNMYSRSNSHTIALCSGQLQIDPVIVVLRNVVEYFELPVQHGHHCVHSPVIVQIAKRGAAMHCRLLEIWTSAGAHVLELPIPQAAQNRIRLRVRPCNDLLRIVQNVATRHKQVFPPVVVKIHDSIRPAGHSHGFPSDSTPAGGIVENQPAAVKQQRKRFLLQCRVSHIRFSIVIDVSEVLAHLIERFPVR